MRELDPADCSDKTTRLEWSSPDVARAVLRAWIARRVREDLADPVRIDRHRRDRVTIMRGIEVRVNRRSRVIMVRGRNGIRADDWLYGAIKLDRPLSGTHWAQAWWWCVRDELSGMLRSFGAGWLDTELPGWINDAARRSGLLRAARRQAIGALRLNPRLVSRARALCRDGLATSDHYVKVWRASRAAKQRMREAPRLWPLYDVAQVSPAVELGGLKRAFIDAGLTDGGWKVLCRHGRALWWPIRHCHEFGRGPRREVIFLANLAAATGSGELPPPGLTLALGALGSLNRFDGRNAALLLLPFAAAWRRVESVDNADTRAAFLRGPADRVFGEWMLAPTLPRVPHGASWRWFERWADRQRATSDDERIPWAAFGRARRVNGLRVAPLRTFGAVRLAGLDLRNCMARVSASDRHGALSLFAIRDRKGRALAMFSAARDDYSPLEIRGRHNRGPDAALVRTAHDYLALEREAGQRRALKGLIVRQRV